mgnify:CR=1 FL=1
MRRAAVLLALLALGACVALIPSGDDRLLALAAIAFCGGLLHAINHGIFTPLAAMDVQETGRSILYMVESNPGAGSPFGHQGAAPSIPQTEDEAKALIRSVFGQSTIFKPVE